MSSHTLGPSTYFACPAVSGIQPSTENSTGVGKRNTYAVIESSSDIQETDKGKTIWMWQDEADEVLGGPLGKEKRVITVS